MKHYITQLRDDANDYWFSHYGAEATVHPNIEWKDSSYHNDACPSICADLDGNAEWYVQLFALLWFSSASTLSTPILIIKFWRYSIWFPLLWVLHSEHCLWQLSSAKRS